MTSTTRQRFERLSGRVSAMETRSAILASFFSSWTWNLETCLTILPNFGCGTRLIAFTTMVLSILSEMTSPMRVLRRPRVLISVVSGDMVAVSLMVLLGGCCLGLLGDGRGNPSDVAADGFQKMRLFELSALLL